MDTIRYDCPAWARDPRPDWVAPYLAGPALPPPYRDRDKPLATATAGIDFWQANHFIVYRDETAAYLYGDYADAARAVQPDAETLPGCAAMAQALAGHLTDPWQQLEALVAGVVDRCPHPTDPPLSPYIEKGRGIASDDALLATGAGWCNEQARVLIRLCQLVGLPGRLVYLFYTKSGHTIAEIWIDGRWTMVDSTWGLIFRDADGRGLSAADCHAPDLAGRYLGPAYRARMDQLLAMDDAYLVGRACDSPADIPARAAKERENLDALTADHAATRLWRFGLLNYPWPV